MERHSNIKRIIERKSTKGDLQVLNKNPGHWMPFCNILVPAFDQNVRYKLKKKKRIAMKLERRNITPKEQINNKKKKKKKKKA